MAPLTYQQVESLLGQLSWQAKLQVFYKIARDLGTPSPGVEKNRGVCGGSACIVRTRIPSWTLVALKKQKVLDTILLQSYPTLRQDDLNNAWAYYENNVLEIDTEIQTNEMD